MSFKKTKTEHKMTEIQAQSVERGDTRRLVVAALDESSQADDVFEFVCSHFNNPETLVVFTYVAKEIDSLFNSFVVQASEAQKKGYLAEGWVKRAMELKMQFRGMGKVLVGDPREELVTFCDHLKPHCLVMGSHGRKALSRMMLGSVSDYCVHFCSCPVIVVKPPPVKKAPHDSNGYSSVFRLAAKTFNFQNFLRDKTKDKAADALHEIAKKEVIELEEVVPMDSPFPPKEKEGEKFPVSDAPFAVVPQVEGA